MLEKNARGWKKYQKILDRNRLARAAQDIEGRRQTLSPAQWETLLEGIARGDIKHLRNSQNPKFKKMLRSELLSPAHRDLLLEFGLERMIHRQALHRKWWQEQYNAHERATQGPDGRMKKGSPYTGTGYTATAAWNNALLESARAKGGAGDARYARILEHRKKEGGPRRRTQKRKGK